MQAVSRGGYAKGDARREAIVEIATEIFGALGYRAATMLQIAAACGISRTGLLHHFPTKESLLEAVLSARDDPGRLEPTQPQDDRDTLRRLVSIAGRNAATPGIVNLFSVLAAEAGDPQHPAHPYFLQRYAALRADLTAVLQRLADRSELVAGADPASLAVDLIALMDGLQIQWVLEPAAIDMAAVLRRRIDAALLRPIGPGQPPS